MLAVLFSLILAYGLIVSQGYLIPLCHVVVRAGVLSIFSKFSALRDAGHFPHVPIERNQLRISFSVLIVFLVSFSVTFKDSRVRPRSSSAN